jgi:hypothetical protein
VRGVGLKVLAGAGPQIDTTTANGRLAFDIFAAFADSNVTLSRNARTRGLQRHPHEGSCLSEDSLFGLCGRLRCFADCVFGGAFPPAGRRAVLAAASASKRFSDLRSVTVVLFIDQFLRTARPLRLEGFAASLGINVAARTPEKYATLRDKRPIRPS